MTSELLGSYVRKSEAERFGLCCTRILSKIKLTAAGCDHIPAWLHRSCSYELADIVTAILNCSISTGKVPSYWLNAVVTPVPKVHKPVTFSDYRPISVTPHISRIAEKIIVRRWLQPNIPAESITDQYAYTPAVLLLL